MMIWNWTMTSPGLFLNCVGYISDCRLRENYVVGVLSKENWWKTYFMLVFILQNAQNNENDFHANWILQRLWSNIHIISHTRNNYMLKSSLCFCRRIWCIDASGTNTIWCNILKLSIVIHISKMKIWIQSCWNNIFSPTKSRRTCVLVCS